MDRKIRGSAWAWGGTLAILLLLELLHQAYLTRANPDAVFMDSLRLIHQLDAWQNGHMALRDFWNQGPHRGLIFQALLLLNVELFSLDPLLANRATGLVILAAAYLVVKKFQTTGSSTGTSTGGLGTDLLVSCLLAWLLFSWAGFEVLLLDLGLALWLKNLIFLSYFAAQERQFASNLGRVPGILNSVALAVVAALIVLLVGMGWSYAFVGSLLVVQVLVAADRYFRRQPMPMIVHLPVAAALGALMLYVFLGGGVGNDAGSPRSLVALGLGTLRLIPYSLGSTLAGVEALQSQPWGFPAAWIFGGLSAAVGVGTLIRRIKRGASAGSLFPLYLLAYGLLTAFSVTLARADGGPGGVMASRYYMDLVLYLVAIIWLWADELRSPAGAGSRWPKSLFAAFCAMLVAGQAFTAWIEWRTAPYRATAFLAINQSLLKADDEAPDAALLQAPSEHIRLAVAVMRKRQLSVFATRDAEPCALSALTYISGWYGTEPQGVWSSGTASLRVPACTCRLATNAYIPPAFAARQLSITTTAGGLIVRVNLEPGVLTPVHLPSSTTPTTYAIIASKVTNPANDGLGSDSRDLGALWSTPGFTCP